jgi:hypothetical protein
MRIQRRPKNPVYHEPIEGLVEPRQGVDKRSPNGVCGVGTRCPPYVPQPL